MIDNRGGNLKNNGNIGGGNTIINSGTIGDINVQEDTEIMEKLEEAIKIIKNSTEFDNDEKECILEQIEAIKEEKDIAKKEKILTRVKLMGSKLFNFTSLISSIITIYQAIPKN